MLTSNKLGTVQYKIGKFINHNFQINSKGIYLHTHYYTFKNENTKIEN